MTNYIERIERLHFARLLKQALTMIRKEKTMTEFQFHCDPGHAWLEVSIAQLCMVGLDYLDFTTCSYVGKDGSMFLEEDCDAGKFINAYAAKYEGNDIRFKEVTHCGNAPCRSMPKNHAGMWDGSPS